MKKAPTSREGKKQEAASRIVETALNLFIKHGYDETTLDVIAEAAGISRRTFFSYFNSKEEILLAVHMNSFSDALEAAVEAHEITASPFELIKIVLLDLVSRFETKESIIVDRLMTSTEALRVRKQAGFIRMEERLLKALQSHWTEPQYSVSLQLVAMTSIGTLRISIDQWRENGGARPVAEYLRENLDLLISPHI
jgi:AcrR family transcriptional regulator